VHCAFDLLELDGKDLRAGRSKSERLRLPRCSRART
jgi:ATP-dependent DNA ligase